MTTWVCVLAATGCQLFGDARGPTSPTASRPAPVPADSSRLPPPAPSETRVITMDSTWLLAGRNLWVRVGLPGEVARSGWRFSVDDTAVAQIRYDGGTVSVVALRTPGTTTLRALRGNDSLTRTLTIASLPPPYEYPVVDSVAVLGGWTQDDETARQPVVHLRVRPGGPAVTLLALLLDVDDLHASARCTGPALRIADSAPVRVGPAPAEYYNGYQTPPGGLGALLRLMLRDAEGRLRMVEIPTRTASHLVGFMAPTPSAWRCE